MGIRNIQKKLENSIYDSITFSILIVQHYLVFTLGSSRKYIWLKSKVFKISNVQGWLINVARLLDRQEQCV